MFESFVYQGNSLLGEVQIHPQNTKADVLRRIGGIRISRLSPPSERCPPLAVLHTIAPGGVPFKMESKPRLESTSPISALHDVCFRENKDSMVIQVLKAVPSTMKGRRISIETDPQRISGMLSEIKRYEEDKSILKQYSENDQVVEDGKVIKFQSECFVRLRPAWEELRKYLTARHRKRFEVYVCTMAERDYALEMWRLLDPDSNLITSRELLDRIVCVKSAIDDQLKVWDDKDRPRVHVVPAFAPYYAPQAET
ncbi:RNA polymerase II C-terminal domain phosphatase-like 1 [Acorus calamus]|uniref:protein-serine/threonine phosphatase n=1 Tax=Acorus calamus TaxID=4465 RepID=A0AAV9CNY9_ACOCL|nr:RNA polymerase II C-terminal domain phosphatase-like 1 [Acorus calamus]